MTEGQDFRGIEDDDVSVVEALGSLLELRIVHAAQTQPGPTRSDTGMRVALARLAAKRRRTEGVISCFDAVEVPAVSLRKYLVERLHKHAGCSGACYVLATAYIDRFLTSHKQAFALSALNVHRLVLVSVVVAAKFLDDKRCLNSYYARLGGVALEELNYLETQFLQLLGWNVYVSTEQFESYYKALVPKQVGDPSCDAKAPDHSSSSRVPNARPSKLKANAVRRFASPCQCNSTVSCSKATAASLEAVVRGKPMNNRATSVPVGCLICRKYGKRLRRSWMSRTLLRWHIR